MEFESSLTNLWKQNQENFLGLFALTPDDFAWQYANFNLIFDIFSAVVEDLQQCENYFTQDELNKYELCND